MYSLFNKNILGVLIGFLFLVSMVYAASPANVNLGTAEDFIVLAKAGISATGTTFINGDIGVSPIDSTAITGFGALPLDPTGQFSTSVLVSGKIYASDYASPTPTKLGIAIGDMQTAYTDALLRPTSVLNAGDGAGEIGGLTLETGVYTFDGDSSNVLISTDLTLNGNSSDVWIFQIPGTFNLANGIKVNLIGGAIAKNVFWVVTGATTLGTDSVLQGTVLDATSISIQTNATLNGNALAQTAVTLQSNSINDTTLPIITRIGLMDVNVDFNSIYIDSSATAFDSVDGNLTDSIITFNDVNTQEAGNYIVTYNVTDLSGNNAVEVIRNVIVLENEVVEHNYSIQTNPVTPNVNGWFNVPVKVSFVHDANTQIRFCRSDSLNNTGCLKINPDWNSTNDLPEFIPKDAQDYNIYSTVLTYPLDGNNYIKYFAISGNEIVEEFNVENAIMHYLPIDKTAPNQQMFFTVAYAPDSYRGISMSTTFPYPITTTSGLILAKLSLTPSGIDSLSGINYCQVNFDYALDNNNWGAKLSAEESMNLSYRYTTTGAKVIAAFCVDNADNNKMWLSTSVPFYHVTVVDINYPTSVSILTANPSPLNLNSDYNLIFTAPDANALRSVMFDVNGINYSFDINAIKNLDGKFYATITSDSNRMMGLVNVTAKVTDNSGFVEYFSNDFNSVKDSTVISLIASDLTQTSVSFDLNSNNLVDAQLRTDINWDDFTADFNNQTLAVWNLSELSPSTSYTYYVLSLDENQNRIVNTISFTTAPTPVVSTGGGSTVGGPRVTPPAVIPEVETGPTTPDVTDNTNTNGDNPELDVTTGNGVDTNPTSPATGAFGLIENDSNSQASPTGLFGFGSVSPLWIWILLIIPAAMLFVASQRIRNQREEAEDEEKRKRDEELAKRSNKK